MKKIKNSNFCLLILTFILVANVQSSQAQFFKKLKEKVSMKKPKIELQVSDTSQVFNTWNHGASDLVLFVVTEFDPSKRTHIVGKITEDGSFSYKLPDSIGTSVPISAYAEECTNAQDATIKNPEVKMALAKLLVGQNKEFIGAMNAVNPVEAVYNLGNNKEHNGEKGDTYLWVYADGEASIHIKCHKKFTMRNEKGQAYKDKVDAESNINIELKKGWNLLRTKVTESIPVSMSLHYTKNELSIVDALPEDIQWVYQSNKN